MLPFCKQLTLYAKDGKRYLSDVINEDGVNKLRFIIPKSKMPEFEAWLKGGLDPIDEQSKRKAFELYKANLVEDEEVGKAVSLLKIHAYLFEGLYPFTGRIRSVTISKGNFTFANAEYLPQTLKSVESMPQSTLEQIVEKYVEMNIAHPFMEGNGRATRIWLDMILPKSFIDAWIGQRLARKSISGQWSSALLTTLK